MILLGAALGTSDRGGGDLARFALTTALLGAGAALFEGRYWRRSVIPVAIIDEDQHVDEASTAALGRALWRSAIMAIVVAVLMTATGPAGDLATGGGILAGFAFAHAVGAGVLWRAQQRERRMLVGLRGERPAFRLRRAGTFVWAGPLGARASAPREAGCAERREVRGLANRPRDGSGCRAVRNDAHLLSYSPHRNYRK